MRGHLFDAVLIHFETGLDGTRSVTTFAKSFCGPTGFAVSWVLSGHCKPVGVRGDNSLEQKRVVRGREVWGQGLLECPARRHRGRRQTRRSLLAKALQSMTRVALERRMCRGRMSSRGEKGCDGVVRGRR